MRAFYVVLLSCVASFATAAYEPKMEVVVDPDELANQLNSEICATNWSQVQDFYKDLRDAENRDTQFPNPSTYSEQAYLKREGEISWLVGGVVQILQPYLGKRLTNVTVDLFTWCIYPLSTTSDIYGCINSTERWSTPGFKALGFLDAMNLKNVSRWAHRKGNLLLNIPGIRHISALKGAMVSCTITLPDNHTIGIYYYLDLEPHTQSTLLGISPQSDAFLVEGQRKNFTCRSRGDSVIGHTWYESDQHGHYSRICQTISVYDKCDDTSAYQLQFQDGMQGRISGCVFSLPHARLTNDTTFLIFNSPTLNDTGEYKCSSSSNKPGLMLSIDVVFTKLPMKEIILSKGTTSSLTCEMKAPSDAMIYWTRTIDKKECQIPVVNGTHQNEINVAICTTTDAVVYKTERVIDDKYSLFHMELQIIKVDSDHIGKYFCNVEYVDTGCLTDTQLIKQKSTISAVN